MRETLLLFHGELGLTSQVALHLRWRVRTECNFLPWSYETMVHYVHLFIHLCVHLF